VGAAGEPRRRGVASALRAEGTPAGGVRGANVRQRAKKYCARAARHDTVFLPMYFIAGNVALLAVTVGLLVGTLRLRKRR
jgi:hypothetical protein